MFLQSINQFFLLLFISLFLGCSEIVKDIPHHTLFYDEPALVWEEALPLGNGRFGAMVFGNPINDRIQLNDDSLWPHDLEWEHPPGKPENLITVRKALFDGDAKSADSLMVHYFSNKSITRSHQTLGDLFLDWEHNEITDYKRFLDLNTALSITEYKSEGFDVKQKVFVSHPHQIMVISLSSDHPNGLNGKIRLDRPLDEGHKTVNVRSFNQRIIMEGEVTQRAGKFRSEPAPILSGVKFQTHLLSQKIGGNIKSTNGILEVSGVKNLTLLIATNSDYYSPLYIQKNLKKFKNWID